MNVFESSDHHEQQNGQYDNFYKGYWHKNAFSSWPASISIHGDQSRAATTAGTPVNVSKLF